MNSFKKITAVISAFSILFAFASCGKNSPEVTTTAPETTTAQTITQINETTIAEATTVIETTEE